MNYKIAVFVGSLRKDSYNRRLARAIERLMPDNFSFEYLRIDNLPLYSQDFDKDYPPIARKLKQGVEAADGLLFVTPEYNRGIPGVLKNAIDIASRPWGTNSFAGKPGAIMGVSIGATGTSMAQQQLRNVLAYLDVPLLGQPEMYLHFREGLITPDGEVTNEDTKTFLKSFVVRYVSWLERFKN